MVALEPPVTGDKPIGQSNRAGAEAGRQGWGFLSAQKTANLKNGDTAKDSREGSSTSLVPETQLFSQDLTIRCEYEKRVVPLVVSKCIEEVELRGLDMEGIYRKSGSANQVKTIQANFEKDYTTADISDPDLDIHAVTSTLKQYFRKLPNPLIAFECYDALMETAEGEGDQDALALRIRDVIDTLPLCHRDTLEFLLFHLVRVMERQEENLVSTTLMDRREANNCR